MSVLNRKLLRELYGNKGTLLAIASIIAVGVTTYVYMHSAYHNLRLAQGQYYAEGKMADFWIDVKKAPASELEALAATPGVAEVRSRIQFLVSIDLPHVDRLLNGQTISLPDAREPTINDVLIRQGGYFTDRRENEVIVADAFAQKHDLHPGQWIHLILNNRRQEVFIVGTAISPEYVYQLGPGAIMPDPEHFGVLYLKRGYAEDVFDFNGAANQLVGRVDRDARPKLAAMLRDFENELEPYGVFAATSLDDQISNRFVTDEINGLGVMANIIPSIFVVVAALVLNVLLNRLVDQQQTIIGTLKAIGYEDRSIFVYYLKLSLAVGLVGGAAGCFFGYLMAGYVMSVYKQFFEFPRLDNRFYPNVYAAAILLSVFCAVAGALRSARMAMKLRPAESMRPKPPAAGGAIWLEKFALFWKQLSFSWRMVLRGVMRNRFRTAVGLFAASMGTSLLFVSFIMYASFFFLIDFEFGKTVLYDVQLNFDQEQTIDAVSEASRLSGVERAEPIFNLPCTFTHGWRRKKGAITGLASDAQLTVPRDASGRPIRIPETGLSVSRKIAELLGLHVGDEVTIQPDKGLRRETTAPIVSIADTYLGAAVYADIRYLRRLAGEESATSGVQLKVNPHERGALFLEAKTLPALQSIDVRSDTVDNMRKTFLETNLVVVFLLIIFSGVIFFGSVLNASLVSLAERQREVATLHVLGYTNWRIGGMFLKESTLVNVTGTAIGLPIGYSLGMLINALYDTDSFRFPLYAPPWTWLVTFALATFFALAAHLVVQIAVNRLDSRAALNARE